MVLFASRPRWWLFASVALVAASAAGWTRSSALSQDEAASPFVSSTVDLGIVCTNAEKSRDFYVNGLGLQQVAEFGAPGEFLKKCGLTDNQSIQVTVLAVDKTPGATKLKLMDFPQAPGARVNQSFLHSTYGFRYITLMVADLKASVARAEQAGHRPIGEGPQPLPEGLPAGMGLATFRDPDGNFVELVGPYIP